MEPYYERDGITIYNCDCREVGGFLGECAVDSIVTDPPYGLAFMGKEWDHGVPGEQFWSTLSEVCKPGAMMLAFGGTRKFHRLACAIEDAGWEIRDCINWLYGSGFPKSLDISKAIDKAAGAEREIVGSRTSAYGTDTRSRDRVSRADGGAGYFVGSDAKEVQLTGGPATDSAKLWQGWGTALKPAWEPIIVAMKSLDGTFAANALKHGVAGLNIDGCRVGSCGGTARSGQADYPKKADGTEDRSGTWARTGHAIVELESGRWPANLIHDGSDEVVSVFPFAGGAAAPVRGTENSEKTANTFGKYKGRAASDQRDGGGTAARFFYCAKASKKDRGEGNTHPTVKPSSLMEYLLQLVSTPTGGLVLDPFMGSGSTLVAAKALGRRAIGIEINKEYCDIAVQRLAGN